MLALVLLIFFTAGAVMADAVFRTHKTVYPNDMPTVTSSQKVLNSRTHLMQSPGTIIDSTFYDWQRNGSMDDHLEVFDDAGTIKVNGTMMIAYQDDTADRAQQYYHFNGSTWTGHGATVFPVRNGFGSMSQFSDGRVAICTHGDVDAGGTRCYAAYDAFVGIYAFSFQGTDDTNLHIWPRISVNSDGSITMTGVIQANSDVSVTKAADAVSPFAAWTNLRTLMPNWMDGDMEWPSVHSGTNGNVAIAMPDIAGPMRLVESTDNGDTWTVNEIAPADTAGAPAGIDSTAARAPWIVADVMFVGDEAHVLWTGGQIGNTGGGSYGIFDFKTEILHWSASTGISTVATAMYQSADDTRPDYVIPADNHLSADFATLGVATDGTTLVCAYVSFDPADADSTSIPAGYAFGDIWVTYSTDDGATWATPVNFTNSPGWDDLYPGLARTSIDNAADPGMDAYIIYSSDDRAGTFVQGTEGGLNMDYIMFSGIDIVGVGIGDDQDGPGAGLPKVAALSQNYPNPFNPSTTIRYQVAEQSHVSLKIYDVRGRLVQTLVNEVKDAGDYSIQWNGLESSGQQVSSGIYLYTMETGENFKSTRKMVVLK
jgi:hypothetical protein